MYQHLAKRVTLVEVAGEAGVTDLTIGNMAIKTATIAAEILVAAVAAEIAAAVAPEKRRPRKMAEPDMTATPMAAEIKEVNLVAKVGAEGAIIQDTSGID